MIFRLALLQTRSAGRDRERNIQTILSRLREAAAKGADLLLLPDFFI